MFEDKINEFFNKLESEINNINGQLTTEDCSVQKLTFLKRRVSLMYTAYLESYDKIVTEETNISKNQLLQIASSLIFLPINIIITLINIPLGLASILLYLAFLKKYLTNFTSKKALKKINENYSQISPLFENVYKGITRELELKTAVLEETDIDKLGKDIVSEFTCTLPEDIFIDDYINELLYSDEETKRLILNKKSN